MRRTLAVVLTVAACNILHAYPAVSASRTLDFLSTESVLRWINGYRSKPDLAGVPHAVKALARLGAFKDPEQAGAYIGFIAGVIGANPQEAARIIETLLPLPAENHWVIVRAIAYSGHPQWKRLLMKFRERMPARTVMIDAHLSGKLPTLFQVAPKRTQTLGQRLRSYVSYNTYFGDKPKAPRDALEPSPELLDTFWGYYFATGRYRPVSRIVAMLPMSKDGESLELLTLGNMAKFTLASNASRDFKLLAMLKRANEQAPKEIAPVLKEVIDAAETVETARIRKEALAAIEDLRRKGPSSRRELSRWGQVGLGALSLGCIGAAAMGAVALGLPCVVGGAMSQAGLRYWESQQ
jgi:hypothetical protein